MRVRNKSERGQGRHTGKREERCWMHAGQRRQPANNQGLDDETDDDDDDDGSDDGNDRAHVVSCHVVAYCYWYCSCFSSLTLEMELGRWVLITASAF